MYMYVCIYIYIHIHTCTHKHIPIHYIIVCYIISYYVTLHHLIFLATGRAGGVSNSRAPGVETCIYTHVIVLVNAIITYYAH